MVSATWNSALLLLSFKNKRPRNIVAARRSSAVALTLVFFYHPGLNKIMFGRVSKALHILTSIFKKLRNSLHSIMNENEWQKTGRKMFSSERIISFSEKKTFFSSPSLPFVLWYSGIPSVPNQRRQQSTASELIKKSLSFSMEGLHDVISVAAPTASEKPCSTLNSVSIFWLAHIV